MPFADKQPILDELTRLENLHKANPVDRRRQFTRVAVRGDAELHPIDRMRFKRRPIEIALRGIGQTGVDFLSKQPLDPNSTWRCCFLRQGHVIGEQAMIVRRCNPVGNGNLFLVGSQFIIDTGLILILGIDPALLAQGDKPGPDSFLPPGEVA